MPTTIGGTATKPTASIGVPIQGGDTDTWGDYLNSTTIAGLLGFILWLQERVPRPELEVTQTAHGFAVGDVLRNDGTSWVKSTADTAANGVVLGVVASVADANNFSLALGGVVGGLTGLTAGATLYLQDAGGLGATAGTVSIPVAIATSATSIVLLLIGGGGGPLSINAQTGTTYALALSDAEGMVTLDNASPITLTVPPNSSVAFPVGTVVAVAQLGAGAVTVSPGSGVTITSLASATSLSGQGAKGKLVQIAADTWLLSGDLA